MGQGGSGHPQLSPPSLDKGGGNSQAWGDQEGVGAPQWRLQEKARGRGLHCYLFHRFQISCLFMSPIYFYSPLHSIT